jgi:hypothetical protein
VGEIPWEDGQRRLSARLDDLEGFVAEHAGGLLVKFGGKVLDRLAPELARSGVRHSPERIVAIGPDPDGRIVFLETGSPSAGLEHILQKQGQFALRGVGQDQLAD